MEIGDKVLVKEGYGSIFYKEGAKGVLLEIDSDGDWLVDFGKDKCVMQDGLRGKAIWFANHRRLAMIGEK